MERVNLLTYISNVYITTAILACLEHSHIYIYIYILFIFFKSKEKYANGSRAKQKKKHWDKLKSLKSALKLYLLWYNWRFFQYLWKKCNFYCAWKQPKWCLFHIPRVRGLKVLKFFLSCFKRSPCMMCGKENKEDILHLLNFSGEWYFYKKMKRKNLQSYMESAASPLRVKVSHVGRLFLLFPSRTRVL